MHTNSDSTNYIWSVSATGVDMYGDTVDLVIALDGYCGATELYWWAPIGIERKIGHGFPSLQAAKNALENLHTDFEIESINRDSIRIHKIKVRIIKTMDIVEEIEVN